VEATVMIAKTIPKQSINIEH